MYFRKKRQRNGRIALAAKSLVPRRNGFTLIELILVLLFVSILAAIAVPRWADSLQSLRATNAANRIVADLALARAAAYGSSSSRTVTFSVGSGNYTIDNVSSLEQPTGTYSVVLSDDPYRSRLVSVWGQTGEQSITFDGYGKPNRGGIIVVAAGDHQKSIVISADSGTAVLP